MTKVRYLLLSIGVFSVGGCGDKGSTISAIARLDPPLTVQMLTVSGRGDGQAWTWHASDFHRSLEWPTPTARQRGTRARGQLEVSFRLEKSGLILSEGSVVLPLRSDSGWTIEVVSATADPARACFLCGGSKAFPLAEAYRGPERDSVWLLWRGNSIVGGSKN